MDYSLITEEQIRKQYRKLKPGLRLFLDSQQAVNTVRRIAREHYFDEERTLMLEQLVGLTVLGFVPPEKLVLEISENLLLNPRHAKELLEELRRRVLRPIQDELEGASALPETPRAVNRALESLEKIEAVPIVPEISKVVPLKALLEEKPVAAKEKEVMVRVAPPTAETAKEDEPLILYKASGDETKEKKPLSIRGFTFPSFKFFGKDKSVATEAPKARLEAGEVAETAKSSEKKVVHYSELRTPLTPFGVPEEEIINLETFQKSVPPPPPSPAKPMPQVPQPAAEPAASDTTDKTPVAEDALLPQPTDKKSGFWWFKPRASAPVSAAPPKEQGVMEKSPVPEPQPKLEGNVVDLR